MPCSISGPPATTPSTSFPNRRPRKYVMPASYVAHTVIDSPTGELTLVAHDGVLAGLYMDDQRHRPAPETFGVPDAEPFDRVIGQLGEYFDGARTEFDVPLSLR